MLYCPAVEMRLAGDVEALTRFGRALADPVRCRLLLALHDGPGTPADLAVSSASPGTRLSNHLACLRGCGLRASRSRWITGRGTSWPTHGSGTP